MANMIFTTIFIAITIRLGRAPWFLISFITGDYHCLIGAKCHRLSRVFTSLREIALREYFTTDSRLADKHPFY